MLPRMNFFYSVRGEASSLLKSSSVTGCIDVSTKLPMPMWRLSFKSETLGFKNRARKKSCQLGVWIRLLLLCFYGESLCTPSELLIAGTQKLTTLDNSLEAQQVRNGKEVRDDELLSITK